MTNDELRDCLLDAVALCTLVLSDHAAHPETRDSAAWLRAHFESLLAELAQDPEK